MPLYEYYCESCNGVFEAMRPMREAALSVPCPECNRDGQRMMSSFSAFTFRDGYPRRLPDKGTYWHLGKEVKRPAKRMRHWEHPELAKPRPKPRPTKGDIAVQQEREMLSRSEQQRRDRWGVDGTGRRTKKARAPKRERKTLGSA